MMLRGLWKLTWIEIKIFLREPLGAFGTIGFPVLIFLVLGRVAGRGQAPSSFAPTGFIRVGLPVLASILIALSAVLSLVTIISIYREGGILKRLRATPLRPADNSCRPRDREADTHRVDAGLDGPGRQTLLPGRCACSIFLVHDCAADQHLEHPVDRFSHRQHCSHGSFCAADRRHHSVPDDRCLGTLRAG